MYQQVNLTLMGQWCSGKVVSQYSGLRGFDSQCGCSRVLSTILYSFFSYDNVLCILSCIF